MTFAGRMVLALGLAMVVAGGGARAAVIHVDADVPGGLSDGTSWTNAYSSLQTAIASATSGDEIWVAAGTYKPTSTTDRMLTFTLKNGVGIYGGFAGTEGSRNARDVTANVTILSGEIGAIGRADNSYHVVTDGGTDATAILDGFTITAGNANGTSMEQNGSALLGTGSPTIANCTIRENWATGPAVLSNGGSPTFTNCTFARNRSTSSVSAISMGGGTPAFTNCTFDRNTGPNGAVNSGNSSATFTNCRFTNNTATTYAAGAMYLNGGTVTIRNAVFTGNTAVQQAGAIFTQNGTVTITNALFSGNRANWGAAVWAGSSSNVTLTNCTITNNTATTSGIVAMDVATLTIRNSIVWNNSGTFAFNGSPTVTYSDVQGGYSGTGNINADPLFLNGGTPGDARLSAGSPAIDAADNTVVPGGVTTDLAGSARFFDDPATSDTGVGPAPVADMGAYEFSGAISGVNLSVTTGGEGTGHAGSTPPGIDCGSTCSVNFTSGTQVTLTATPDVGMVFTGWSGACSGDASCIVTLNSATSVTASFAPLRYVDAGATGDESGLTWANASTSLATALADAVSGTEIWVKKGTHTPGSLRSSTFAVTNGVKLYGGFAGTETSRAQRDPVSHRTILSGEIGTSAMSDNCYHVVTTDSSTTSSTIIDGFVIIRGNADGGGFDSHGAGILANGSPEIRNCVIAGNAAHSSNGAGGGVFFATNAATPRIVNCALIGNSATYGGGVYSAATLTMTNCTVTANRATSTGAFYGGSATNTIANTIVWNNTGGAIGGNAAVTYSIVEGGFTGTGNLNADPLFVDPGGWNVRLQSSSPAIDVGSNAAVPSSIATDADLASRFVGTVDIGPYEHATNRLTVTKFGDGTGTVSGGAINCGSTCIATLTAGTQVTLNATADLGWKFTGWGGPCSGTGACTVTVPAHVTARFGKVYFVNWAATGANDGTSWANAFTSLSSAITASTGLADDLWVAAGTYKPTAGSDRSATFTIESGAGIYGGFAATETDRAQRNVAANVTTLSGEIGSASASDNSYHVVTSTTADASAIVDGVTITGGYADNFSGNGYRGGGVLIESSWPTIRNCTISGNYAYRGGGVSALTAGSPVITDSVITANTAVQFGGGVELYNTSAQLLDGEVHTNTATQNGGSGAGIYVEGGKPRIRGCEIYANTIGMNGWGAGIRVLNSNAQILDCTIRDNSAGTNSSGGGGLYVDVNGSWLPSVANCRITGNTANISAGIHLLGTFTMTNCTVANNTAASTGGGASVIGYSPTIANSIFWGNSPDQIYNTGSPTVTYSDVQGGFTGTGNIDADPLFVNAAGGNFRSGATSPAVDAGSNNASSSLSTDIEGKPRRVDAPRTDTGLGTAPLVDMGAYEFYPVTVSAPSNASECIGGSASFTVTATGWGALSFQWRKNTATPVGTNAATYTIDPVAANSGGSYDVVVTDSIGTSATSSAATLSVSAAPSISADPGDQTICSGSTASFSVTANGPGLTYQWRRNGNPIDGATASTYQIPGAVPANNGSYDVVVSGTCSPPATSAAATLVVNTPPQVSDDPDNVTVCAGQPATFVAAATGAGLTYQWRRNGNPIDGATSATYTIPSTTTANAGSYDVVVSGTCSPPATSAAATLVVNTTATINAHPQNVTVCRNQPVQLTVGVTGVGLTYQWRRNTVPIDGASSTTYSIASVLASQAGSYDVVISSACAAPVTSNAATVTVQTPPEIDVPPANLAVCQGQQAQLSVIATGTNVGYQWRKGGQNIDGAIQSTYTIPSALAAHAGNYDVVLTGTCGTLTSPIAVLTVNTQPSISSFTPLSGSVGTQVVIGGSGLTGTTSVTFNGSAATFTVDSDTQITATVPAGATSGPISVAKGGCTTATSSGGFTVLGGFGAPANLLATAISSTQIFVSWSAVSGVNHYELWRQNGGAGFTLLATPVGNAYADTCGSGATCAYKVRAVDAIGTMSGFSNADLATTLFFTDDVPAIIRAVHWTELRTAVNAVRAAAGLAPAAFTDSSLAGLRPKAVHLNELRAALDPARAALGVPAIVYGEAVSAGTTVKATHVTEIRNGVK